MSSGSNTLLDELIEQILKEADDLIKETDAFTGDVYNNLESGKNILFSSQSSSVTVYSESSTTEEGFAASGGRVQNSFQYVSINGQEVYRSSGSFAESF